MHNLHFIRVVAETGEDACSTAETFIEDWGNENNWRTICGAVSQDNEVFDNTDTYGGGRYKPSDTGYTSIEKINEVVDNWTKNTFYGQTAKELIENGKSITDFTTHELWSLKEYAKHLYAVKSFQGDDNDKKFDILVDEFRPFDFDECGVTNYDGDDEGKIWIVFVDMHS